MIAPPLGSERRHCPRVEAANKATRGRLRCLRGSAEGWRTAPRSVRACGSHGACRRVAGPLMGRREGFVPSAFPQSPDAPNLQKAARARPAAKYSFHFSFNAVAARRPETRSGIPRPWNARGIPQLESVARQREPAWPEVVRRMSDEATFTGGAALLKRKRSRVRDSSFRVLSTRASSQGSDQEVVTAKVVCRCCHTSPSPPSLCQMPRLRGTATSGACS
ncbi:unnamed protein product [Lampetra fluviatilis]